jgi:hypothetical protein
MYGNTHLVADAIGDGLRAAAEVVVLPVDMAGPELAATADLVVVGGPTHAHGISRPSTRKAAVEAANKPGSDLELDPDAEGPGLREWFESFGAFAERVPTSCSITTRAAAFDTRIHAPAALTGRASKGIARRLRHHGFELVADPESFLVTKHNHLEPDEAARARHWGKELAEIMASPGRGMAHSTT